MNINELWIVFFFFWICISFGINSAKMKKIKNSIEDSDDKNIKEVLKFNYEMNILLSKFIFSSTGMLFLLGALILKQFN